MESALRLTVLGTRGSLPVSGPDFSEFGGATSCYLVEAGGREIYLDAGTGILRAPAGAAEGKEIAVLLTHAHIDHVLGPPMVPALSEPGREILVVGKAREGLTTERQLARYLSAPLWPCGLEAYPARVGIRDEEGPFRLGGVLVESMEGSHPGGCSVFKLSCGGKSLVLATDFEPEGDAAERLADFARDTDLLLYDAQYAGEDYEQHKGYGHSTAEAGLAVFRASGAKRLLLIHHDPAANDGTLRAREARLACEGARYAREGEVYEL